MSSKITKFPPDAEQRPYDDVSWTLGQLYRVTTTPVSDPAILELEDLEPVEREVRFPGTLHGRGGDARRPDASTCPDL